ncbi:MAG: hypothetical protein QM703_01280 [Gemmatales bacterium]
MLLDIILIAACLGIAIYVGKISHGRLFDPADPCYVEPTFTGWIYRPDGYHWFSTVVSLLMFSAVVFMTAIYGHRVGPELFYLALAAVILAPIGIAYWTTSSFAIRADQVEETWTLNPANGAVTIPIGAIHDITVVEHLDMTSSPDEVKGYFRIEIEWYTAEAELHRTQLRKVYGSFEAQRVAAWLKQQATAIAPMI